MRPITIHDLKMIVLLILALIVRPGAGFAQTLPPTPDSRPTPALTLLEEKQKLELERLRLENEKLKFEMEKAKYESSKDSASKGENSKEVKRRNAEAMIAEMSQKAEALAKENKSKENLLIVDFVNSEIWLQGVRYSVHEIQDMAEDHHWNTNRRIEERSNAGDPRYLYRIKNVSLLKYLGQKRGIITLKPASNEGDFAILTTEGITLDSSIGEVRTAHKNAYFNYEGEDHPDKMAVLKYIHGVEWNFSDRLEYVFNKEGKIVSIRYGVLDEH